MTTTIEDRRDARAQTPDGNRPRTRRITPGRRFTSAFPWYLMMLGAIVLVACLILWPFLNSVILSFQKASLAGGPEIWVGWDNYIRLLQDPQMWKSLGNTVLFTFASVALQLGIAWGLALLLWGTIKRAGTTVRVLFAIPMLLSPVVVAIMWRVLLDPLYGWIPALLGWSDVALLSNPNTAMATMILIETWQWMPFMFLIIAAGLNSIPEETLEAARMDGASGWRLFRTIIWPLTLPVTLVAILFRGLDTFKTFDLPFNLTAGGPGTSTQTIAMYLYEKAFIYLESGYASAISMLATAVMAGFACIVLAFINATNRSIL